MQKIGILSDTHGFLDEKIIDFFNDRDQIWHAGDIGSMVILEQLENYKPIKAVYGNIDDYTMRRALQEQFLFECEGRKIFITHIGGYPGRYDPRAVETFETFKPDIFVCGHSHILKIQHDKKYNLLHINPGAAGKSGLHKFRTAVRFTIDGIEIKDMEVLEMKR